MTRTTSPSEDARRLDRAFGKLIDLFRSDKEDGAGQRATKVHGLEILRFEARLGVPLFPAEPVSQVIAALGRDYELFSYLLSLWQQVDHPVADLRIDQIGEDRATVLEYMTELLHREVPGIYSEATTVEQLETLLTAPAVPTGRIDYAALKERIDIVDYISRYVQLRKSGTRFVAKCPFHNEKTGSFVVYPNTRSYYCFGCMAGGDVIDFAKRAHGSLPQVA